MNAMASTASSNSESPGGIIYQDRVIYKEGENKENKILEEQLRNKDNLLRNEQEEKRLLREKLEQLQGNFQKKGTDSDDKNELQKIKKLKEKLKQQKKKEEQFRK